MKALFNRVSAALLNPRVEVAIGSIALGLVAGGASYHHENAKRGQIPLAFSEISQLKRDAAAQGIKIPPLTMFYAALNDTVMQVFEANNLAYNGSFLSWKNKTEGFAYELEKKNDPAMRIHTLISDYARVLPGYAKAASASVAKLAEANRDFPDIIRAFDASWSASHNDVTRTETEEKTVCETDSKGHEHCHTETESHQVYDHTVHHYRYDREQGARAAQLLQAFIAKYPDVRIDEKILTASKTNAENEWAMRESRRHLPGYKPLNQNDYDGLKDVWAAGSNYVALTPVIDQDHAALVTQTPLWAAAKKTAHTESYITYSHSDSGPREYRVAEKTLAFARDESEKMSAITDGIAYAGSEIPSFEDKVTKFINAALHYGEGNAKTMGREVLQQARDLYTSNYAGGFDPYPSNWWMVVLLSALGTAAGGGAGYGVARYKDNKSLQFA